MENILMRQEEQKMNRHLVSLVLAFESMMEFASKEQEDPA
jgi:hypothetical protein